MDGTTHTAAGTRFDIETILAMVKAYRTRHGPEDVELAGTRIRLSKSVLRTFALDGTCCAACELQASHFELAALPAKNGMSEHLTLQLVGYQEGTRTVFTQDHSWAQSLGGGNEPANLKTMCQTCNHRKSKLENKLVNLLRAEAGLLPNGRYSGSKEMPDLKAAMKAAGKLSIWQSLAQTYGAPRCLDPLPPERITLFAARMKVRAAALGLDVKHYQKCCEHAGQSRAAAPEERPHQTHADQVGLSLNAFIVAQMDYNERHQSPSKVAQSLVQSARALGLQVLTPEILLEPAKARRSRRP